MRSSDTPESDLPKIQESSPGGLTSSTGTPGLIETAPQGPSDWSREKASDDMLSEEARQRIGEVLAELYKTERGEP